MAQRQEREEKKRREEEERKERMRLKKEKAEAALKEKRGPIEGIDTSKICKYGSNYTSNNSF